MASIRQILRGHLQTAISLALGPEFAATDPLLQPVSAPHFGDYQANFAMGLAKKLGKKPVDIAKQVADHFHYPDICEELQVSGPGFINLLLSKRFLEQNLQAVLTDPRLGISKTTTAETTLVEYGSPNVAKEMHVGHLRSLIIGDALARILSFLGHEVIRQSHNGDWGTQFGMLIQQILDTGWDQTQQHSLADVSALYKQAKQRFDADAEFAKRAREQVVALQSGEAKAIKIWQSLVHESEQHFQEIYQQLGLLLTKEDIRGESFYNPMLSNVVKELTTVGLAETSEGAIVVFLPGFVDKENNPIPFIIQKSDGGYLYATTDLAAAKFRIQQLHAKRLIYVVDARQSQHFAMLYATLRKAGWATDEIRLEHAAFGSVLGHDRKPFKTRSGETIQLSTLIEESVKRAAEVIANKSQLSTDQRTHIAKVVGIGALKYADLSSDKIKDYVFDWDRMLAFEGNTAPYLQNAYVRIQAIFRKGNINIQEFYSQPIQLQETVEHQLALRILELSDMIYLTADELAPHKLCNYLHDLAATYHKFYEACPVLTAEQATTRNSRLLLSDLCARTLRLGLNLLGIEVLEQM